MQVMKIVTDRINTSKQLKQVLIENEPKSLFSKIAYNKSTEEKLRLKNMYHIAIAISGEEVHIPEMSNTELFIDLIRFIERTINRQESLRRLCVFSMTLKLNDRVTQEFETAVLCNDKDKCMLIITEEKQRREQLEISRAELLAKSAQNRFDKAVNEILIYLRSAMDSDGRPISKDVNIGVINKHLIALYKKEEIIEAYKQFLDTSAYQIFISMIERKLNNEKS